MENEPSIKSYCAAAILDEGKWVVQYDEHKWIVEYANFLKSFQNPIYTDPDMKYDLRKDCLFYKTLVDFLNMREQEMKKATNDPRWTWKYEACGYVSGNATPAGIKATNQDKMVCIYLRSDQFGFSAPQRSKMNRLEYPYAGYLTKSADTNRFQNVARWIWITRTIGGSFIWAIQKWGTWQSVYNRERGVNRYIQDRVDLTLFEAIKYFNNSLDVGDVLFEELRRNPFMKTWLDHFGTFETFVDFFLLEDFVVKENYIDQESGETKTRYIPKNIVESKEGQDCPLTEEYVQAVKSAGGVIQTLSVNDVENMLKNVSRWISNRSKSIEEELSKSENGTDCNT